ncbi:type VI secretion system tip protein VgrG [Pseudoduganella flava]|uniref:Type VI secretion system tip protein VgrG n=1 Tax=Pseudoduganella flava TaxID=871742 RepID=A0ABX6G099_9BURK|nr:type VI secretion system tip protein VgrG [Pseudoduganella flava]
MKVAFPHNDGPAAALAVNSLFAQEELSRGFRFDVELLSDDVSIPLKAMIGRMMTVSLLRDDGSVRHFNGYITEFRYMKTDGGFVYYYAVLEPWLAFAKLRKNCVSFKGRSVTEVTELVFAQYPQHDWKTCMQAEDPKVSYMNQYNETDYNHLHRRWETAGFYYWYEHRADGHTLWLADDSTMAAAIDACGSREVDPGSIPFRAFGGSYERDGISQWQAVRRMGSGATALASFDYKRPAPYIAGRESENRQGDAVPSYELYENLGEYAYRSGADGEAMARRRMEEADRMTQYFEAAGNDRSAMPGRCFKLTEHHSSTMKWPVRNVALRDPIGQRDYLIISVRHWAGNNIHSSEAEPSYYKNELTCQRKAIRWRPGRNFHSEPPPAPGVQTAIVTGPQGEEIYTDGYGRVKVQFHWDRASKRDENSSAWVRVAMPMAGREFGQVGLPRVGQEVVVQFLGENPDRPIITGLVYNEHHHAPWALPGQCALSGLRSRELAGQRCNQMVLDDTNGQIQAQLRSDHLHSQLALGDIHRLDTTAGHLERRGEGFELRTDGHGVMRAAMGMVVTTEPRTAGAGAVKAMPDTLRRLAQAQAQHESMAKLAQQHDQQEAGAQADTASALAKQNDGIKGSVSKLPELSSPHLVISSSAGIATAAEQSVHIASGEQLALTSAQNVSVAAFGGLFASVRQGLRMFVHKVGMKLIAASGDVDIQALSNSINLLAKLNIIQSANRITITAKDEIVLNGGGSYIKLGAAGIEQGSKGKVTVHGAKHEFLGPKNLNVANTMPPQSEQQGKAMFNLGSHAAASGRPQAGVPYKLYKDGALVEEGKLDETGSFAFEHENDTDSKYAVELPSGDTYEVEAGEQLAPHQVSSGMGHHGYEPSGPSLTKNAASLEEDRLLSNPAMRNIS